jgi:hypothetical protein
LAIASGAFGEGGRLAGAADALRQTRHVPTSPRDNKSVARTHVGNILGKLGVSSRAQVAAWVVEHRNP